MHALLFRSLRSAGSRKTLATPRGRRPDRVYITPRGEKMSPLKQELNMKQVLSIYGCILLSSIILSTSFAHPSLPPAEVSSEVASSGLAENPYNPQKFTKNSPQWTLEMIKYLLFLKNSGVKINYSEVGENSNLTPKALAKPDEDPIVCQVRPYDYCYRVDKYGRYHPIGDRVPVRVLRVYKRAAKESAKRSGVL